LAYMGEASTFAVDAAWGFVVFAGSMMRVEDRLVNIVRLFFI
jgi:hypothetical protein